jgi:hypothetical protein
MALKARIKSIDEAPEALREFYTEKDGSFVLSVEGAVPKDRLDEFRDSNIALKKQIDDLTVKFGDVDPAKYRDLLDKEQQQREKKLIDAGKVEELLAERTGAMKAEFEKQTKALETDRATLTRQLEGLVIDNGLRDAAAKAGVRPTAIDDVLLRGRAIFRLQDGQAVPMDGDKPVFGKEGNPMAIGEWVGSLVEKAPHLFEPSIGGGAPKGVQQGGVNNGKIARDDNAAFLKNIDAIASGQAQVV